MLHTRRAAPLIGLVMITLVGCASAQVPPSITYDLAPLPQQTSSAPAPPSSTTTPDPTPVPTATSTSTRTAMPTATATVMATPVPDPQAAAIVRVDTDQPYVAITIDDFFTFSNYREREGIRLLQAANDIGAQLTVCPTGYALEAYNIVAPEQLAQIRQLISDGGHEICNHTLSHPFLGKMDHAEQLHEMRAGSDLIVKHLGQPLGPVLRPPFGDWNEATRKASAEAGFPYVVAWTIDSGDWIDPQPSVDTIVSHVSCSQAGDIILLHANRVVSSEALVQIIEQLRARGLEPVPLSTLIESGIPVEMQSATDYSNVRYCPG